MSPIITKKKFNDFINYAIQEESKSTSEYERVLEFIKQRGASCIKLASHDKRIFATEDSNSNVEIFSLSPQDNDLIRYLRSLVRPDKAGKTAYEFKEDNILSIVLLIKLLDNGILLGSDLETTNKDHEGWDAVVNNYTHLKCHPSIFKVPHHGSENGHNNFVWEKILRQKPISILTAYNKGYKLPKDSDIDRIKKLSEKLYVIGSKSKQDKELKLSILNQMLDLIDGTLFRQTMFAEFEDFLYKTLESEKPFTSEILGNKFYELQKKYNGKHVNTLEIGKNDWSRVDHFYYVYYVYKYATSICASLAIAKKILAGDIKARDNYLNFLKLGSSVSPLEALKVAGVDLSDKEVINDAISMFKSYLYEYKKLKEIN